MDADNSSDEPAPELPECRRFRSNLALFVSSEDLGVPGAEMRRHIESCPACLRELEAYRQQHRLLGDYGRELRRAGPDGDPPIWDGLEARLPGSRSPQRGPWSPA